MIRIQSFEEWETTLYDHQQLLLFVKTDNCLVCEGLFPQVTALQADFPFPFYLVNVAETPEIAGQLSLFTAPVVLLFDEGKEYARFARFVPIEELKRRMKELIDRGKRIG